MGLLDNEYLETIENRAFEAVKLEESIQNIIKGIIAWNDVNCEGCQVSPCLAYIKVYTTLTTPKGGKQYDMVTEKYIVSTWPHPQDPERAYEINCIRRQFNQMFESMREQGNTIHSIELIRLS